MCMSFVAVGGNLTIVNYVAFKMTALWFWTMFNCNPPMARCHPLLWGGGILVDHWSTISSFPCSETETSSRWLPWSSLETLKTSFNVPGDDHGSHSVDFSVSVVLYQTYRPNVQTAVEWLIHNTKHRKDNQSKSLKHSRSFQSFHLRIYQGYLPKWDWLTLAISGICSILNFLVM